METRELEKHTVQETMIKLGGSFVASLGIALSHADPINVRKIKQAFPEYWQEYLELGNKINKGEFE